MLHVPKNNKNIIVCNHTKAVGVASSFIYVHGSLGCSASLKCIFMFARSYLNHPVASSRCEGLFPQNTDAGVEPLRTVWEWGLLLLAADLWVIRNYHYYHSLHHIKHLHNLQHWCCHLWFFWAIKAFLASLWVTLFTTQTFLIFMWERVLSLPALLQSGVMLQMMLH